jgi:hypothetical protein
MQRMTLIFHHHRSYHIFKWGLLVMVLLMASHIALAQEGNTTTPEASLPIQHHLLMCSPQHA